MKLKDGLKKIRKDHELTRKELAEIIGCSLSHVINLERGVTSLAHEKQLRLIKHFDLSLDFFKFDPDPEESDDNRYDYDVLIGRNVKRLRKQAGLTQQELAEELGYSNSGPISQIELGKRPISKKSILKLADLLGVHIAEIMTFDSDSFDEDEEITSLKSDFNLILKSKTKPSVYDSIENLIRLGAQEIRGFSNQ